MGNRPHIDLNCDLGEGCGNDAAVMPLIRSANIACGGHAGDENSMRSTLQLCREFDVRAGAHPGYADPEYFGRREIDLPKGRIADLVLDQIQRLSRIAQEEGVALTHVKPHGALYNQAARHADMAEAIAAAVHAFDPRLTLVGLADSELTRAGTRAGLAVAHEAFADRRYLADGRLASRAVHGAVIEDVDSAVAQAISIVLRQRVDTLDHAVLHLHADTLCLHGDRADAVELARRMRQAFAVEGIAIA
jgi:UPF0271 protein